MRIDSFGQIQQLYGLTGKNSRVQQTGSTGFSDKLQLSDSGKDYQVAKAYVAQSPDVRQDKISALKEQIANGTYDVSPESFADKILAGYQASGSIAF